MYMYVYIKRQPFDVVRHIFVYTPRKKSIFIYSIIMSIKSHHTVQ